ncbi:YhdP family protein [Thaumasiovibrio sp. DFM-14]|uniref:YhdP family protein n=1 Tax=Thaumasiovibrio sp. DFM-14 TaxID=3384792 RepID=UPI0039A2E4D2
MWALLTFFVVVAILVTTLRFLLPQLNQFREPISLWASRQSEVYIDIGEIEGVWTMSGPDLSLKQLTITQPGQNDALLSLHDIDLKLDLWRSLLRFKPVFSDINLRGIDLDFTKIAELDPEYRRQKALNDGPALSPQRENIQYQLEQLFFVQLEQFNIFDANIAIWTPSGEKQHLFIPELKWVNQSGTHLAQGQMSLADAPETQVAIRANLRKPMVGFAFSGLFYIEASNVSVAHWLTDSVREHIALQDSDISFQNWIEIERGTLKQAQWVIEPSQLTWLDEGNTQQLAVTSGILSLTPASDGWLFDTQQLVVSANGIEWPDLAFRGRMHTQGWDINLATVELAALTPLYPLFPSAQPYLDALRPGGIVNDVRIGWDQTQGLSYSARVENLALQQWALLPGINKLNIDVRGSNGAGSAYLSLTDDILPYGEVFQAPLVIDDSQIALHWQVNELGWRLWSDALTLATPHLNVNGEFRLDFPTDQPAWLAYYGEVDVIDAAQTWRYLPSLALGEGLTQYLSGAVQGGQAQGAQLLWYGALQDFPYTNHRGIFQVDLTLENAMYDFYSGWPGLDNADVHLLFENASMYINAENAQTLGAKASQIKGVIPSLAGNGHLDISMNLASTGAEVRHYMAASPLNTSVGAALDYLQPSGPVTGQLALSIPFDDRDVEVRGDVLFDNNSLQLTAPELLLTNIAGRLRYDGTDIRADELQGQLYAQPVSVSLEGYSSSVDDYRVEVDLSGDWSVSEIAEQFDFSPLAEIQGVFPWRGQLVVEVDDEVNYQIALHGELNALNSSLPYPLDWSNVEHRPLDISITGGTEQLSARGSVEDIRLALSMALDDTPYVTASYLGIGDTQWRKLSPQQHAVTLRAEQFDLDRWIQLIPEQQASDSPTRANHLIPLPTRVNAEVELLKLATMDWHELSLALRRHPESWHALINSREVNGSVTWPEDQPVNVDLQEAYLHFAALNEVDHSQPYEANPVPPKVGAFEQTLMRYIPEIDLAIQTAWLQGFRLGEVSGHLRKEHNTLLLQQFEIESGDTYVSMDGHWIVRGDSSESQFIVELDAANSSDLMGRFSISGGLENASMNTYGAIEWQGAPWQVHRESMNGEIRTRMGKGTIAQVGGAGRLLGMFSLESILRKMQLDFSGVFDDGLPFNYLVGSGRLENGIFSSNNIEMETLAGDLKIAGEADLVNEWVDANVRFTPDFTSGLPTLTAFAVAPQSALLVFAVSTILSPVIDVFTQVSYQIEGPIDEPVVRERSRSTGEIRLKSLEEE